MKIKRTQRGSILHTGKSWFVRYCDDVRQPDGTLKRKLLCKKLDVEYGGDYRTRRSIQPFVDRILAPINSGVLTPLSTMPLREFTEKVFIPEHIEKLRPASIKQAKDIWRNHVKAYVDGFTLREFRTYHGQQIMDKIAERDGLGHSSLCHAKSFLSGAFKFALQKGFLEGYSGAKHEPQNPMMNVRVPKTKKAKEDSYAYSLSEIKSMLAVLPEPARTVVLTAAFSGLRKSELRGLTWGSYNGAQLSVDRSVWNSTVSEPKTERSRSPVPVVPLLAEALAAHKLRAGKLAQPTLPIFQGGTGEPLNLDNLSRRVIIPSIEKCLKCGKPKSEHPTEGHLFELDKTLCWHGWHSFRRGLATNLHTLRIADREIQAILRHSNIAITQKIYIKSLNESQVSAMDSLSEKFATCNELAINRQERTN